MGLAQFDGVTWTVYDSGNSGLPDNRVECLVIDVRGNVWIGTSGSIWTGGGGAGLAVYREGGVILPGTPTNAAPASWGWLKKMFR